MIWVGLVGSSISIVFSRNGILLANDMCIIRHYDTNIY